MAAKHFTDLQCWRLADALRAKIIAICARPHVARHFKFCDSALDSAASVCRNISEGFTRFKSAYIVQFFTYGLASLAEIQDHLIEAEARGFIDAAEKRRLWDHSEHVKATMRNFMKPHRRKRRRRTPPDT